MRCSYCNAKIGFFRRLVDREFCCEDHKLRATGTYSARSLRDDEYSGNYEAWLPNVGERQKRKATFGPGYGIMLVVLGTLVILFLPGGGGIQPPAQPMSYAAPANGLKSSFYRVFPGGRPSLSMKEEFKMDLRNWQPRGEFASSDWQQLGAAVRVGQLRLWKPTLSLANYNVNFGAQIDQRAVSWAVRASDHGHYYATKVNIDPAGAVIGGRVVPRAEIVRYAVLGGKASTKIQMPIPIALERGKVYEIAMRVSGSRFVTAINGQVVDTWSDDRIRRGGVGFFSDPGERATLHWVNINEREGFLQRFLSFSMFIGPWDLPLE